MTKKKALKKLAKETRRRKDLEGKYANLLDIYNFQKRLRENRTPWGELKALTKAEREALWESLQKNNKLDVSFGRPY